MPRMLKAMLLISMLVTSALGLSQETPPSIQLLLPKSGMAGAKVKGTVRITFEPGLHAYQNPPTKDYMIPVTITSRSKGFVVKPRYPIGEMILFAGEMVAAYSGTVDIPIVVTLPKSAGTSAFKVEVGYQQCTKEICFKAESVTLSTKIQIKKPAKK